MIRDSVPAPGSGSRGLRRPDGRLGKRNMHQTRPEWNEPGWLPGDLKIAFPPRPPDVQVTPGLGAGKQCCPAHRVSAHIMPQVAKASLSAVPIVGSDDSP